MFVYPTQKYPQQKYWGFSFYPNTNYQFMQNRNYWILVQKLKINKNENYRKKTLWRNQL